MLEHKQTNKREVNSMNTNADATLEMLRELIEGAEFSALSDHCEILGDIFMAFEVLDAECVRGFLPTAWQVDRDPVGTHIQSLIPLAIRVADRLTSAMEAAARRERSLWIAAAHNGLAVLTHYVSLLHADFCE